MDSRNALPNDDVWVEAEIVRDHHHQHKHQFHQRQSRCQLQVAMVHQHLQYQGNQRKLLVDLISVVRTFWVTWWPGCQKRAQGAGGSLASISITQILAIGAIRFGRCDT